MKIFKYGLGLLLSVMLLSSCESKWPYYTTTNEDVTWELSSKTYSLQAEETPIEITIQRGVATEALSVPITLTDPHNVYTVNTNTVNFAAGEYKKTIVITYSYAALTPGTEYTFDLSFNNSLAGPGSFSTMKGNGMMKLQYEDWSTATPYVFWYVDLNAMAFTYRMGSINEECDATTFKVQLAKGTTSYFKIIAFDSPGGTPAEVEFKDNGDGSITLDKYAGYNETATKWDASQRRLEVDAIVNGNKYHFTIAENYCMDFDMTKGGGYMEFGGWITKNGNNFPNQYNSYRDYIIN